MESFETPIIIHSVPGPATVLKDVLPYFQYDLKMLLVRFSGLSFGGLLTIRCRMDMVCPETHNGAQMWGYRHRSGTTEQIGHAEEAAFENLVNTCIPPSLSERLLACIGFECQ